MDGVAGSSLLPLHHCKTLHLVRHAQGIHNVEGEHNYQAYLSPALFAACLTPLGWAQVDNSRKHVHECGLAKRIDLVITSPLQRVKIKQLKREGLPFAFLMMLQNSAVNQLSNTMIPMFHFCWRPAMMKAQMFGRLPFMGLASVQSSVDLILNL